VGRKAAVINMSKAESILEELAAPVCEEMGVYIYSCEYKKEGGNYYLRLFIDKDGGVTIEDCENVSRRVNELLDEKDPIPEAYIFEVSSPGMDRKLTRDWHFEKVIGSEVDVKLFAPIDGSKQLTGILAGYDSGLITLKVGEQVLHIEKGKTSSVRLSINF
jgi:ribosome maturation factor RimP